MRTCACGCGAEVVGRQRFLNDAHRKRAARQRRRNPDEPGPSSLEAAVRRLAEDFPRVPPPLSEALLMIARQLDANPASSPLWGRFAGLLEQALEAYTRSAPEDPGVRTALWSVRTLCRRPADHLPPPGGEALLACARCYQTPYIGPR